MAEELNGKFATLLTLNPAIMFASLVSIVISGDCGIFSLETAGV